MTIIAITAEPGSQGAAVAAELARRLNLSQANAAVADYLRRKLDLPQAVIDFLLDGKMPAQTDENSHALSDPDLSLCVAAAVFGEAARGNVIIAMPCAAWLMQQVAQVLSVRLYAPRARRAKNLWAETGATHSGTDALRHAENQLRHEDDMRDHALRRLFGANWDSPALYDLAIDTQVMSLPACADKIKAMTLLPQFAGSEPDRLKLANCHLMAQIRFALHGQGRSRETAPLRREAPLDDIVLGEENLIGLRQPRRNNAAFKTLKACHE